MKHLVLSSKTVEQTAADLQIAIKNNGFGVLHTLDLQKTLAGKGVNLANECLILDVCNPHKAAEVLAVDMALNLALPCRISVYSENNQTYIGMISPKAMLALLSDAPGLAAAAADVENTLLTIMREASQ